MAARKKAPPKKAPKKAAKKSKKPNLTVIDGGKDGDNVNAARHNAALVGAYNHFNRALFGSELVGAIVTCGKLSRRTNGTYRHESWIDPVTGERQNEICLNANIMRVRAKDPVEAIKLVYGTLVHEMCHEWQYKFGSPSRNNYHNGEFSKKMESVGLITTSTGKKDGKRTGQSVTHYIEEGGVFEKALAELPDEFKLPFLGLFTRPKESTGGYVKYVCPNCEACVRGKPDLNIRCNDCKRTFRVEIS